MKLVVGSDTVRTKLSFELLLLVPGKDNKNKAEESSCIFLAFFCSVWQKEKLLLMEDNLLLMTGIVLEAFSREKRISR